VRTRRDFRTFPTPHRRLRRGRQRAYTPSTLSFDAGTIDEKTLARQLHKHDANDGAVLDDNNCAARFSARARVELPRHRRDVVRTQLTGQFPQAEELERLFAYEETASELYTSQARGRKAWPAYVPSAISDGALKAAAAFGVTYVKSDTHSADGHQASSDDDASDSEAEEPSRKSGSTATRSYHTGRTPADDDEEEFQFDEVAPTKKRRVINDMDSDDE
jgi:hypothetical protein